MEISTAKMFPQRIAPGPDLHLSVIGLTNFKNILSVAEVHSKYIKQLSLAGSFSWILHRRKSIVKYVVLIKLLPIIT